jgi:hypothetical protein
MTDSPHSGQTIEAFRALRDCSGGIETELTRHFEQKARRLFTVVNPLSIINNYLQIVSQKLGGDTSEPELDILRGDLPGRTDYPGNLGDHAEQTGRETVNATASLRE